ncbi:N-hydroxyarylamine O-acetyltransferase [Caulobacter sp. CCUG 60055]|uniref:arylamine N-acetyltransferase family protein n=1 Tax=Caulobacter sp. CCUG 60055 TaxID=2100090 RepID=UPI001FA6B4EA|nr:arylamine N-acetyltransferase [Caulobacter sp. CCUG 60055]MCI3181195.1 N-hydroxyarylamine O-acetyltransferase [Caulobacter sp. CCUG 60055]
MAFDLDAYLARVGDDGSRAPTAATLDRLIAAHTQAIAFENLDPLFGAPPSLDLDDIAAKLVDRRRGGYCFEQNALFRAALDALGFRTTGLLARVVWGAAEDAPTPPLTHMLLRLDIDGEPWMADVGFGGQTPTAALRLVAGLEQATPHGLYRLNETEDGFRLELRLEPGRWAGLYRFTLEPRARADYEVSNWYSATHPSARFVSHLVAARTEGPLRHTLLNDQVSLRRPDGTVETRPIAGPRELAEVLDRVFGLTSPAPLDAIWARLPKA